jgi:tetratricopeptide (TPR) repeat protein
MGFGSGATRRDIHIALEPILQAGEPELPFERGRLLLDIILDALLNEKRQRQRFVAQYATIDVDTVRWLGIEYALLEERQTEDGEGRVFRASKEAINLYTSMLGLDLEDAAIADAAVLRYQAERGRLDDAIQTAHQAQIRAKQYAEHIRTRLEVARRDVEQVAWVGQVLPVIEEALKLIGNRMEKERELRRGLELRRDQANGPDLAKLTRLLNEIEKSERTNLDLHRLLLTANQQFRDEHARQRLRRPSAALLPNLENDVLLPWLDSRSIDARDRFASALSTAAGVNAPAVAGLDALWSKLLAPPVVVNPAEAEIEPPDTVQLAKYPPPFAREDFEASARFLRSSLTGPRRLSELLADARQQALPKPACRLVVLSSMQQFGAAVERRQFRVEPGGKEFATDGFAGDDLVLSRS